MTIEINRDDLISLAEAARSNGSSLMLMLKTNDGKRCALVVSAPVKRTRNRKAASPKAASQET